MIIEIKCPKCSQIYEMDSTDLGQEVECTICHNPFIAEIDKKERYKVDLTEKKDNKEKVKNIDEVKTTEAKKEDTKTSDFFSKTIGILKADRTFHDSILDFARIIVLVLIILLVIGAIISFCPIENTITKSGSLESIQDYYRFLYMLYKVAGVICAFIMLIIPLTLLAIERNTRHLRQK